MKSALGALLLAIATVGCNDDFTEVDKSRLNQAFILNSSPTFQGYDYLGSDGNYHYFAAKWKYGQDQRFKISTPNLAVTEPMPLGARAFEVFPYRPTTLDCKEFGKLGDTTLFQEK